jgi:hypothetical protein
MARDKGPGKIFIDQVKNKDILLGFISFESFNFSRTYNYRSRHKESDSKIHPQTVSCSDCKNDCNQQLDD